MENELIASKDFYLLSVDIFKILSLERNTRMVNGKVYLDEMYQTYCKLIENSNIVSKEMKNMIMPRNFTPKLLSETKKELSETKKEVENELVVMKRSLKKYEPDEEDMEEKEREEDCSSSYLASSSLEKENSMIIELEENNNAFQSKEEKEKKEKDKDNEEVETIEEENTTTHVPSVTEDKVKRKYTKKKVPDV
jgi:hypothetical protein